jgi:hypothetical protein
LAAQWNVSTSVWSYALRSSSKWLSSLLQGIQGYRKIPEFVIVIVEILIENQLILSISHAEAKFTNAKVQRKGKE